MKLAQIRAHIENKDGSHFSGSWTSCNACRPVYKQVTTKYQQALDTYRRSPCNLTPVTTIYGGLIYIAKDDPLTAPVKVYKKNGDPVLHQYNREAPYTPAAIDPTHIVKG